MPARISLVLLDLVMPGTDGIEVLNQLNGKPGIPPVIVETANGSIDAAINAMRAGAVDFVVKPASPERLECSIKNALKIEQLSGEITRIKKKAEGSLTFDDLIISTDTMERVDFARPAGGRLAISQCSSKANRASARS